MGDTLSLVEKARGLANLQEQMDNIFIPRQTHKAMIDCLRACAAALSARPTDTRVVTVAQLERWLEYISDFAPEPRAEIRATIGGQANE